MSCHQPPALIVFAKIPEPGRVKTRLTPPLTPRQAADLYAAFLGDALDGFVAQARGDDPLGLGHPVAVRLYLDTDAPLPDGLVPEGVDVRRQRGAGLGERMARAFVETFAAGHDRAVIVGTDCPTLPMELLAVAFGALDEPMTAVVGPSMDGGYVLLGLNDVDPYLFDMTYSHDGVFAETMERIGACTMQAVVLPLQSDVDDAEGLARLVAAWRAGTPVGPRTAAQLRRLAGLVEGAQAADEAILSQPSESGRIRTRRGE